SSSPDSEIDAAAKKIDPNEPAVFSFELAPPPPKRAKSAIPKPVPAAKPTAPASIPKPGMSVAESMATIARIERMVANIKGERPARAETAVMSDARRKQLLSMTPAGRAALQPKKKNPAKK